MKECKPDCLCPLCDREASAIMSMSPLQYSRWLTLNTDRTVRTIRATSAFRTTAPADDLVRDADGIPDPYSRPVAAMRAANSHDDAESDARLRSMSDFRQEIFKDLLTSRLVAHEPSTSPALLEPPDPYEKDLVTLRSSYK